MEQQPTSRKLPDQVRDAPRLKHHSFRTQQAYIGQITRQIPFHNQRHPKHLRVPEVEAFLTHLAVNENMAASTRNRALSVLPVLYRAVLQRELGALDALRAKHPRGLPTVLTQEKTGQVLRFVGQPEHQSGLLVIQPASAR